MTATFAASAFATTASLTTLATFNRTNGAYPFANLTFDAFGNLYGTTQQGGSSNQGTVFKVAADTHLLTTVVSFNGANGAYPGAGLITDASGNLYGTTTQGGSSTYGTIFKVAAGSNTLTTLASFSNTNGSSPLCSLLADASGNLYGTTQYGGTGGGSGYGAVFKLAAGSSTPTALALFNSTNGAWPQAALITDASGNLYGTTAYGGAFGDGTVFKVAAGTNALTTLASFKLSNGYANPKGSLIADPAGNLYGTTEEGGPTGYGAVFRLAAGTNALTTLATFDGTNGAYPVAGLLADAAGNLYGTTQGHGGSGSSTVFRLDASNNYALSTLTTFNGATAQPESSLIADGSGNLYGTTVRGGTGSFGTVFELTGTGFVVPEPAGLLLLLTGFLALLRRQSK
jgi:uncharacterized repeat protein (TIGR03803 family)